MRKRSYYYGFNQSYCRVLEKNQQIFSMVKYSKYFKRVFNMDTMIKKERSSGLESLKIIAVCMIVIDHTVEIIGGGCANYLVDVSQATENIAGYTCLVLHYFGMMADVIFIACSAWFLVNNNCVNKNKIVHFMADKYFITLVFIFAAILLGYDVSPWQISYCLSPNELWFVMCYVLYYAFHPCLNAILKSLNKKSLLRLNIVLIFLYSGYIFIFKDHFGGGYYCRLLGFFVIYFIVAYVKKYMAVFNISLKKNVVLLCTAFIGQLGMLAALEYIGMRVPRFYDEMLRGDTLINPFSILTALAAVNIANKGQFVNHTINYLSSLSLLVYMFHANGPLRRIIAPSVICQWTSNCSVSLVGVISITAIILLIGAMILSIVYKHTLQKNVYKFSERISKFIYVGYKHIENKIIRIE